MIKAKESFTRTSSELATDAQYWFIRNFKALIKSRLVKVSTLVKMNVGIGCKYKKTSGMVLKSNSVM